jgi:GDP-4-dehydro-6-deoxy-D-mannose reductase
VGSHLAEYLLAQPDQHVIFGTMRWRSRTENVDHLQDQIHLIECDIRDGSSTRQAIATAQPDWVFHLAAQSNVMTSWHSPSDTLNTNLIGQINLLEAIRETGHHPLILVPGSSEEYGLTPPEDLPLKETHDTHPLSPYAVSKVAQDYLGYQYANSYAMRIVRTRAFNHTGPRRNNVYAESNFAWQLAQMEKGLLPPVLQTGNLSVIRDYCDVRDVVEAYCLILQRGEPGEVYNICSGQGRTMQEVLQQLLDLSTVKPTITTDPERLRPYDAPALVGDNSRMRERTGWAPHRPLRQTLQDILDYWRARV